MECLAVVKNLKEGEMTELTPLLPGVDKNENMTLTLVKRDKELNFVRLSFMGILIRDLIVCEINGRMVEV